MGLCVQYLEPPETPPPERLTKADLWVEWRIGLQLIRLVAAARELGGLTRGDGSPVVLIQGWKAPVTGGIPPTHHRLDHENTDGLFKMTSTDVTRLLHRWRDGDASALDELTPLLYDELRRLASRQLSRERKDHTLQATEVVHEAFARLVGTDVPWQDRAHFLAVAARTMRRLLVDHARGRAREKRGGGLVRVTLQPHDAVIAPPGEEILALERALSELERRDQRAASVVELHHFGGLTHDEVGLVLGISPSTVKRDLRVAHAWLQRELTTISNAN